MTVDTAAFSHITLGTNDYECAIAFYDAVLATLGFSRLPRPEGKAPVYAKGGDMPYVYLMKPYDGRPATWGNGTHVAFLAADRDEVDAFFRAAMDLGGMDEGAPGPRPHYSESYYAAYVRDPDGNKLQAVCYSGD
jgi:catechol 2,3-dioxygenase-like lactoylglutathione lyase family enzyme